MPELPVVPVVYLPGPGVTKVKAVPVPGEKIIKTVTETVTGNEVVLPEPRTPMRLTVSGNAVRDDEHEANEKNLEQGETTEIIRDHPEKSENDDFIIWLIWLFVLLLFFILAAWLLAVRHKTEKAEDTSERIQDEGDR